MRHLHARGYVTAVVFAAPTTRPVLKQALRRLAARREEADLVALADRAAVELDRLRQVTLEVQPERPPLAHLLDLPCEILGELRILLLDLAQEVAQP